MQYYLYAYKLGTENQKFSMMRLQWDAMGNKSSLLLYGGGAILALWISLVVVRALDSVPLVYS
jgi:hypothetical protein